MCQTLLYTNREIFRGKKAQYLLQNSSWKSVTCSGMHRRHFSQTAVVTALLAHDHSSEYEPLVDTTRYLYPMCPLEEANIPESRGLKSMSRHI